MPSSPNVFCAAGFCEDGFFQLLTVLPPLPLMLNLGEPGDPVSALPFRAAGSSVGDLDLLYGVLGADPAHQDVQPIFAIALRAGISWVWAFERPREAILAIVVEYGRLLDIEDVTVEANPSGPNLFGSVALTTRPLTSVVVDDSDGRFTALSERELLLGAPAGLWWDVAHQVLVPELVGVIQAVASDGVRATITFGHTQRQRNAPSTPTD
jgi:hypothetical protein